MKSVKKRDKFQEFCSRNKKIQMNIQTTGEKPNIDFINYINDISSNEKIHRVVHKSFEVSEL